MIEMEDALRNLAQGFIGPDVPSIRRRVRERRRRRRVVASAVSASLVTGLIAALIVLPDGHASRVISPAVESSAEVPTSRVSASTTTAVKVPDGTSDLTGFGTGLLLASSDVPDGWFVVEAGRINALIGGGGSREVTWRTTVARYTDDRSKVVETIRIDVSPHDTTTPTDVVGNAEVHGLPASQTSTGLTWIEGAWSIDVSHMVPLGVMNDVDPTLILDLAEGLEILDGGRVEARVIPVGFELLAQEPGWTESVGPEFHTVYSSPDSVLGGDLGLVLTVVTQRGQSAEMLLADDMSGRAVEVGGRRVIVGFHDAGFVRAVDVVWDEADASQIRARYTERSNDDDQAAVVARATALIHSLVRAIPAEWTEAQARAVHGLMTLSEMPWVDAALDPLGITPSGRGATSSASGATITITQGTTADGSAVICEFLFRSLTTCTAAASLDPTTTAAVQIDPVADGGIRVMMSHDIAQISVVDADGRGPTYGVLDQLTPDERSPRVFYLDAQQDQATCLRFLDSAGAEVVRRPIFTGSSACG
jgi:hypothetical protein